MAYSLLITATPISANRVTLSSTVRAASTDPQIPYKQFLQVRNSSNVNVFLLEDTGNIGGGDTSDNRTTTISLPTGSYTFVVQLINSATNAPLDLESTAFRIGTPVTQYTGFVITTTTTTVQRPNNVVINVQAVNGTTPAAIAIPIDYSDNGIPKPISNSTGSNGSTVVTIASNSLSIGEHRIFFYADNEQTKVSNVITFTITAQSQVSSISLVADDPLIIDATDPVGFAGTALFSGGAPAAGAVIELLVDFAKVNETTADGTGQFSFIQTFSFTTHTVRARSGLVVSNTISIAPKPTNGGGIGGITAKMALAIGAGVVVIAYVARRR